MRGRLDDDGIAPGSGDVDVRATGRPRVAEPCRERGVASIGGRPRRGEQRADHAGRLAVDREDAGDAAGRHGDRRVPDAQRARLR